MVGGGGGGVSCSRRVGCALEAADYVKEGLRGPNRVFGGGCGAVSGARLTPCDASDQGQVVVLPRRNAPTHVVLLLAGLLAGLPGNLGSRALREHGATRGQWANMGDERAQACAGVATSRRGQQGQTKL